MRATARDLHSCPGEMDVLTRIRAGGREIHCGLATTRHERAAAQAQRFRVCERRGYYRPGLRTDRDVYDTKATAYFLALLPTGHRRGSLLGSARVILGDTRAGFRFPAEHAFEFEPPETIAAIAASQRVEVTRVVAEPVQGIVIGGLLTPLGLIQAISEYVRPLGIRSGLSVIKRRFLRVLQGLGVRLHEIQPARLVYPSDGPVAGYYHRHPDPVVPVYWLVDEIAPSVEQAISTQVSGDTLSTLARDLVTASHENTRPGSTGTDSEAQAAATRRVRYRTDFASHRSWQAYRPSPEACMPLDASTDLATGAWQP